MEKIANDILSQWREEGSRVIPQNFEVFRNLVAQAKGFAQRGNYETAAVYGRMAASCADYQHCGFFVSPELEQLLLEIGRKAIPRQFYPSESKCLPKAPTKILHVSTCVKYLGGHSRMILRWIQQDTECSHSLVVTDESREAIPKTLREAVSNSNGNIYSLKETVGSLLSRAKRLREIAAAADIVVLHIFEYDVVPIIAFANKNGSPPIIFLNFNDHNFWLGVSISDVVANLRESGMRLSKEHRGIEIERNALLPTIVDPIHRVLSRAEAKRQLGLRENSVVLLSIARAPKYKTIDGISYIDTHIPLLEKYEQTFLIVVGPGHREDWSDAIQRFQGRIIVHKQRPDTAIFLQAADIYVDSFPFVSITSLLEAGSYGVPLVSRYPFSSEACEIMGADMPSLTGNLIRAQTLEEYTTVLSRLVEDEEFRLNLGEATRKKIVEIHTGENWQRSLNDIYHLAATVPRIIAPSPAMEMDRMFIGEPNVFIPSIYGSELNWDNLVKLHLTIMPFQQRLQNYFSLFKTSKIDRINERLYSFKYLVPDWFMFRIKQFLGKVEKAEF
jgi:glycosyltransferase involved in cell wall biosynthesis